MVQRAIFRKVHLNLGEPERREMERVSRREEAATQKELGRRDTEQAHRQEAATRWEPGRRVTEQVRSAPRPHLRNLVS